MRVQERDTGGEGKHFIFSTRSGLLFVKALMLGVAAGLVALALGMDDGGWVVVGFGGFALFCVGVMRWTSWNDYPITVTSSTIRLLKSADSTDARRTIDIQHGEPVVAKEGRTFRRAKGGKTVYYNVEHAGHVIASGITGKGEAKKMAKFLDQAIHPPT